MYTITEFRRLTPEAFLMKIEAPPIARKRQAGQFVLVRVDEEGERIPLTLVDSDPVRGTITLVVQEVGTSTKKMGRLKEGGSVKNVIGPLGHATEASQCGLVACLAGGIGVAEVLPVIKAYRSAGNTVTAIIGARTKDLLILEDEVREAADEFHVTTDDGSYGRKGLVTDVLNDMIGEEKAPSLVYAIGPVPMMKAAAEATRPHGIKTLVSLNPLMVDGTGMCGGCRVSVGGESRFACVDGPDFDAHRVDFEELVNRQKAYAEHEHQSLKIFEGGGG